MITVLLETREVILKAYQKVRMIVNPVVKFLFSLLVFSYINQELGFDSRFTKMIVVIALSAISAVTPGAVLVLLSMVLVLLHIYAACKFLALLLLLIFIILYVALLRFSPKQIVVAVAIPVLARYNLHYCIPILMGSISTPIAILPTVCGVAIYHILGIIKEPAAREAELKLDEVVELFTEVFDKIIANKPMIIMMIVFALVIAVVWFIRSFSFDYAFEISLGAGVMLNILGFLIADLKYDVTASIGSLIIMSVVSGLIAMVCDYMKRVLDYTAVERVQFEDDDYYYYVKAVPKVNISLREMDIKHINRRAIDGEDYEYEEETEDEDYEPDMTFDRRAMEEEDEAEAEAEDDVKEYKPSSRRNPFKLLKKPDDLEEEDEKEESGDETEDDYEEEMILDDDFDEEEDDDQKQ
ncbi:MAG: hypothetical protein K6G24_00245 [Lachnospiraceae bacterium]|nr:hypothetical protein [Lachnospiraceae bacterium]